MSDATLTIPGFAMPPGVTITPLRETPCNSQHVYSLCLYREPTFAARHPTRDFRERYTANLPSIVAFTSCTGSKFRIFCDEAMAPAVLAFEEADVYLVKEEVNFPFSQHRWRYFSVLLEDEAVARTRIHHFRGLDNAALEDLTVNHKFTKSQCDLLHAPYFPRRENMDTYMPIRGSCSVAHNGVSALRYWLKEHDMKEPQGAWPNGFHCDEYYLKEFFDATNGRLNLFTVIDREVPADCWQDAQLAMHFGRRVEIHGCFAPSNYLHSSTNKSN